MGTPARRPRRPRPHGVLEGIIAPSGDGGAGGGTSGGPGLEHGTGNPDVRGSGGTQDATSGSGVPGVGSDAAPAPQVSAGGGGGGFYGGGGGQQGGGGGGSGFTADGSGMTNGFRSGDGIVTITYITPLATTTSLTVAPPASSVAGQSVTLTAIVAAVSPGTGTPAGSVTFVDGATEIGAVTLDASGIATFSTGNFAVGPHSFSAVYGGGGQYAGSASTPAVSHSVNKAGTTVVVTATPSQALPGETVVFNVTVDAVAPGAGTPTGTVTLTDGATTLGTVELVGGQASFTTNTLAPGPHQISANYGGDTNFNASTGTAAVTVGRTASTTAVAVAPPSPALDDAVTFTATVTPSTATGTVAFLLDGATTPSATVTLTNGQASYTTVLPAGPHSVVASYSGDASFDPSTSAPASFTIASPTATVITGTYAGRLSVPAGGTVVLRNATVTGRVTVATGGTLDVEHSRVSGSLSASGAAAIRVCGSSVGGTVNIASSTGFVLLGDPGDYACAANTFSASVALSGNRGGLKVAANQVGARLILTSNTGGGPSGEVAPEVVGNRVGGSLACQNNSPPPSNDGQPNIVSGSRSGQCSGL